jgi:hypothetical protein
MIENSSRLNICIDPKPAFLTAAAPREGELPYLALAEFRTGATMAYLQSLRPVLLLVLLTR